MKTIKKTGLLFSLILTAAFLHAGECIQLKNSYEEAGKAYEKSVKNNHDARKRYRLINTAIDKAVALLAYCHDETSLSEQYLLRTRLKKLDKQRSSLASAAIDEYRLKYGIRPKIQTIYQDRRNRTTPSRSTLPLPSRQPFPPVTQPAMPPVLR